MSGINMVLNTAKQSLAANQIGLNVTGNNIANVNTPGYSRQTPVFDNRDPISLSRFTMGTGVEIDGIVRSSNFLIEKQLMNQKSELSRYDEAQSYMTVLESLFNETSENNLSEQLSDFWNSWQGLSNMPTGYPERIAVYDSGARLAEQFQWLSDGMHHIDVDLAHELQAGIDQINALSNQLAEINVDIISSSVNDNPNDLLDKRNTLVSDLAQLIDIQTYEQPTGSLTVATNTGHILVYGADTFQLQLHAGQVSWVDSQGSDVDITDKIKGGKLGGWLEMRDEIIPKVRQELNTLAEELIWSVNLQHSQGVGLNFFSSALTGTYRTDATQMLSTLEFGDRIDDTGEFKIWVRDAGVVSPVPVDITVDMNGSDVTVSNWAGAAPGSFQYKMTVTTGGDVGPAVSDPVISWEKFNPDGSSTGETGTVTVTDVNTLVGTVDGLTFDIGAGALYEGNTFSIHTDAAGAEDALTFNAVSGTAKSVQDTYVFTVKNSGGIGTDPIDIEWRNGATSGTFTVDPTKPAVTVDGMTLDFASGTLFGGETFTVSTDSAGTPTEQMPTQWHWTLSSFATAFNSAADAVAGAGPGSGFVQASITTDNKLTFSPTGTYQFAFSDDSVQDAGLAAALGFNTFFTGASALNMAVNSVLENKDHIAAARLDDAGAYGAGDNSNAIAVADIQYVSHSMTQWTYDRSSSDRSGTTSNTLEGFYQGMIGALGIKSASINRNAQFSQVMVENIQGQRDALSGVNLDEEMVNLMKYQHAFAVASKLLTTADEMLQTLLSVK
ncbi:MAG: flagellar hook-associated protein FlgK [Desulfobacterales bacterium]|jgi:flagellar hook-associated protein FlgK|nr:flagellar hook-associated protein FlgK [Desulfobacterales bacterium]